MVALLATCFHTGSLLGLFFNPEAICSSKTLVDFQHTIWRYTPVDNVSQIFAYVGFTIGFTYAHFKQSNYF
jgi:hypothetical protein